MATLDKKEVPLSVVRHVAGTIYVLKKLKIRFWATLVFVVFMNTDDIAAAFDFPPKDKPFAKFLIAGVALAVWDLTRIRFESKRQGLQEKDAAVREKKAASHPADPASGPKPGFADAPLAQPPQNPDAGTALVPAPGHIGAPVSHETAVPGTFHSESGRQEKREEKKVHKRAIGGFVAALVLFVLYYCLSESYVFPTTFDEGQPNGATKATFEPYFFFEPFMAPVEFRKMVAIQSKIPKYNSGFRELVDNDSEWLKDKLDDLQWHVLATKLMLLIIVLSATALLVWSSTVTYLLEEKDE